MKKISFLEKYFSLQFLMLIAYLFAIIAIVCYAKKDYNSYIEKKRFTLESIGYKIAFDLTNIFDSSELILNDIGKKITHSDLSKDEIGKILIDAELAYHNNLSESELSTGKFYWIDSNNRLLATSDGSLENPIDLSDRDYLQKTSKTFGRIFSGDPIIGASSGQFVIPLGMGIDKKSEYIGTLAISLRVSELLARYLQMVNSSATNFAIFDDKNNMILASDTEIFANDKRLQSDLAKEITATQEFMPRFDLLERKNSYIILHSFDKYPYKIVVGYRNKMMTSDLTSEILPWLILFLFMTMFYAMAAIFLRK